MLPLQFTVLIHCMQHHKPQTTDVNPSSFFGFAVSVCEVLFRADGQVMAVSVFLLCSNDLTVCSMRLLIVCKCRAVF